MERVGTIVGGRLRLLREEAGLRQEDVAARLGVHSNTVRNWERGTTQLKGDDFPAVAAVFGMDATVFFMPVEDFRAALHEVRARYLKAVEIMSFFATEIAPLTTSRLMPVGIPALAGS